MAVISFICYLISQQLVKAKMNLLAKYLSRSSVNDPEPSSEEIFIGYLAHVGLCCLYTTISIGIVQYPRDLRKIIRDTISYTLYRLLILKDILVRMLLDLVCLKQLDI